MPYSERVGCILCTRYNEAHLGHPTSILFFQLLKDLLIFLLTMPISYNIRKEQEGKNKDLEVYEDEKQNELSFL